MNCDQARTEIIAYLKGELQKDRKTRFEEHLARCPACRHELEGARRLLSWTEAASEQNIVGQVERFLDQALSSKASDVHFEPQRDNSLLVRMRVDGVMHEIGIVDAVERYGVITRLKMMAEMDVSETHIPQNGRMPWKIGKQDFDLRVSCTPYIFGEGLVVRILERAGNLMGLDSIWLYPDHLEALRALLHKPMGMIISAGPTGSGKTTTLYSMLLDIKGPWKKVVTIEDPVECHIEGINQSQVNSSEGYTFPAAVRSFMRQDPDIIMISELRDMETLQSCAQAALTGHMVLTAMHTNDSFSSIQRLVESGLEPYLVSATLLGVTAQRLVRRPCENCKEPGDIDYPMAKAMGITQEELETHTIYRGKGCDHCRSTGYYGRAALHDVLTVDRDMAKLIADGAGRDEMIAAAKAKGFVSLMDDAKRKVLDGLTTPEEALRVLAWTS